jgi:hypothetical protein
MIALTFQWPIVCIFLRFISILFLLIDLIQNKDFSQLSEMVIQKFLFSYFTMYTQHINIYMQ